MFPKSRTKNLEEITERQQTTIFTVPIDKAKLFETRFRDYLEFKKNIVELDSEADNISTYNIKNTGNTITIEKYDGDNPQALIRHSYKIIVQGKSSWDATLLGVVCYDSMNKQYEGHLNIAGKNPIPKAQDIYMSSYNDF